MPTELSLSWSVSNASQHAEALVATMTSIRHSSQWDAVRLRSLLASRGDASHLAFHTSSGSLVGYAIAYRVLDYNDCMFPGPATMLRRLYVEPPWRRKGLGLMLINRVISASDVPVMWQTAREATEVIDWFERNGFVAVGEISNGQRVDYIYREEVNVIA
jgi:GNAT superfamily N-acetyltransferase